MKPEGKDSGTYLRVAGTTRHAGEDLVRDLEFQGARRSFDDVPVIAEEVKETDIGKLCEDMYQYALAHARNEAFRVEVYRNQADLMSAIECHVPLVGTPGTQTGTPGTQEQNERGKDESLKKLRTLLRHNPQMKRKELASELGIGLRTVARYLSEMPDVRYVGRDSLGHWEVIDKDRSED